VLNEKQKERKKDMWTRVLTVLLASVDFHR